MLYGGNKGIQIVISALLLAASALLIGKPVWAAVPIPPTFYVSPGGQDGLTRGSKSKPYRTISFALAQAAPGATVVVLPGTYREYIRTVRNGTAKLPITLRAQGRAVLLGNSKQEQVMEIVHDYHRVSGFEFTGQDILLRLIEADYTVIENNYFHHAQGECIRIKYQSSHNRIENNRVEYCGLEDFGGGGDGKNGEGVYIGTAPEQLSKNPTKQPDQSSFNLVHRNRFNTRGNECVDIKEGSEHNLVEFNSCSGQKDTESAGLDARGSYNIFRYNTTFNNAGAGIRFGGDNKTDGIGNEAYGNQILNNSQVAIKVTRLPQGRICGNTAQGNKKGFSNERSIANPTCLFPLLPSGM